MKKKTTLIIVAIVIAIIVIILCGYFFVVDIESKIPNPVKDNIQIETKEYMSRKVFIISPKNGKNDKVILYFHGGAYTAEMTNNHWNFLQNLSNDSKATIIVPDYPLAPKYTYKDVQKMSEALYKDVIKNVGDINLIIMGDSAGGGLALGLTENMSINNIELPTKTILISPWLDTTMSNTQIENIQHNDKDLNKFKLYSAGILYTRCKNEDNNAFVNPINGELSKLKNITIYIGTHDILNPDCHLLYDKAKKVGLDIKIREYEEAQHIWIINNEDDLAKKAYNDLLMEIGE